MNRRVGVVVGTVLSVGLVFCSMAQDKGSGKTTSYTVGSASGSAAKTQPAKKPEAEAKKSEAAKTAGPAGDTLVVVARITEIPGKFPPNDLYNYVYVMKYRVVNVVKGSYSGQELLVGVYNPLIPRSQIKDKMAALAKGNATKFEMGATQKLVLVKPLEKVWKDAVEDEYFDSELDKFYALQADLAK